MLKRRRQQVDKGAPKWMVTFSDLMTLILVFFILLFSMSVVDAQKFNALVESFNQRQVFDFMPSLIENENPADDAENNQSDYDETSADGDTMEMDELLREVQEFIERNQLNEFISATRDDRGVVLVLQERMTFESGEAELLQEAEPFLEKVGTLIEAIPNLVKVEGHTDNRPISTVRYPSNWELSGARASSVIRYLIEQFDVDPQRFMATGFGDTRPVVPNDSNENMQLNRRVVIVISDPTYDEQETF
ncbi:flagellar motor protein MotS [Alkalihalobacillus trypoxylicola]|uniref:Flagellar motor protein MotS n=2 Tax=Alkalihalobacillus trypoxylicola TaxID=519424 RepID=A0A161PX11_9BACI|nr:flagellar motor protein MotS [Alkalihalobacillus trypoxylicola]KYG26682.1 flagellar motor protein MotS [Alkalihalobacillus trypoxylicola]BCB28911.2 flagellar motor protein MotS [Alkalihalobacillus trypoxylicola NBRC 102646]